MKLKLFYNRDRWAFLLVAALLSQAHLQSNPWPTTTNGPDSVRVLVAYYSLTGNTEKMAKGVVEGVKRRPGVAVSLKQVDEVTKQDLESADGIILGCPTYYGTLPGKMKVVIDDWSWKLRPQEAAANSISSVWLNFLRLGAQVKMVARHRPKFGR